MARTKNNQRSANRVAVDVGATGTRPASKGSMAILAVSVLAAIWAVAMMTSIGRVGYLYFFMYAEFYMGVISLVSLSITIMIGLVATDRLVLSIRQRVMLQSTHRTTGVIAVAALFVHVWTKVVEKHIGVLDVFIPFLSQGNRLYVGFGTISGWIMIMVMWTGIARSRFIGRGSPWMWRGIHAISYLMWPIALMHGLSAGRPAKAWVIVSYVICILLVLVGLAVRVSVSFNRRKDFASTATGAMKPVGRLVPTSTPVKKRARPDRSEELAPVAVLDTFQPVAPPVVAPPAPPAAPREEIIPAQRAGRYDDEMPAPAPRQRRVLTDDDYAEPSRAISRRAVEFEPAERPRGRRYPAGDEIEYDEPTARGRRYTIEDTGSRMQRPGPAETGTRMRRPDVEDTGTRMQRPGPADTGTRMRRPDVEDTGTRMRRPDLEDTGTRMRRPGPGEISSRLRVEDTGSFRPVSGAPAPRSRRYADEEEAAPRARRRAEEPRYDDVPRSPSAGGAFDEGPRTRAQRYEEESPRRSSRFESRYNADEDDAPRGRRDRSADLDGDAGRHSRGYPQAGDETPTLVDMASRRARRAEQQDPVGAEAGRGARRGGRGRSDDDSVDEAYWAQLRGEAN